MTKAPFNRIVWSFAFSQTISWAALFYTFPALFSEWERDLGWSKAEISAALTSALLLSALFAPVIGRLIDRRYFTWVHLGGTIAGAILLLMLSRVTQYWQFFTIWSLIGIAMAGVLYEPCFAILTKTFPERSRAAIIRVTLVAGLAGTLAFPATHILVESYGWRTAITVFAAVVATFAFPFAAIASYSAQNYARRTDNAPIVNTGKALNVMRSVTFWLLAFSYFTFALDHSMIITHLLPLLESRDVSLERAVIAATFIGPMQVAGRVVMMRYEKRLSTVAIASFALLALVISASCLLWAGFRMEFVVIFVVLQGAGNGVSSIVRPLLTAELLSRKNFGLISGVMALPFIGGFAIGPYVSAIIWNFNGYDGVLIAAIIISLAGIASLMLAAHYSNN